MRSAIATSLALVIVFTLFPTRLVAADDLRDQYGTASVAAAKALDDGIRLVQGRKPADALPALETALKEDPHCQLAYYWKALAQLDLGEVDESLVTIERLVAVAEQTKVNSVTVDACINVGLTLAKIERDRESRQWFTRAIALDPTDSFHLHWKAYRNMSINCSLRGEHASAALCAFSGYLADPEKVSSQMVLEFISKIGNEEVARALTFDDPAPTVAARGVETSLGDPVSLQGVGENLTQLLVDPAANRIVAVAPRESKYYLIDCGRRNEVSDVEAPGEIVAASVTEGELYLSVRPSAIVKVDPGTGRVLSKWSLSAGAPDSLAIFSARGTILFPADGVLQILDLDTGKTRATKFRAQIVAAGAQQRFCYAFVREESAPTSGHIIIGGRPMFFRSSRVDWAQTALYKFALFENQPILAEMRFNAASNGRQLHVSPDGQWVAIAGGGGWRPQDNGGHGTGYGIAVFTAANLGQVQGFFETEAYPQAVAINPVTGQIAAVRGQDAKVYHVGQEKDPMVLSGPHGSAAAWSPDGRYLYLANKGGLRAWPNTLAPDEVKVGLSWRKEVMPPKRELDSEQGAPKPEPIEAYKIFEIKSDHKETLAAISRAQSDGRTRKPIDWLQYGPYQRDKELSEQFRKQLNLSNREDTGIHIYQLKKLQKTQDPHPGIAFLLGMAYYFAEQLDKSENELLAAIHLDQGRTNITLNSLRGLRRIRERNSDYEAAAYCSAHVLQLDLATPRYLDEAEACFDQAKIGEGGQRLIQRGRQMALTAKPGRLAPFDILPQLPVVEEDQVYSAEQIFAKAAPSVVMIRTGTSTGSGVCVAEKGIILTNQHVVDSRSQGVRVYAYKYLNGRLDRLPPLAATVLYESVAEDLAVLQVDNPPNSLLPLAVATTPPREGAKVWAIGSPGLADDVLDQTISEGIVSSANRRLNGSSFIQHTAAVNEGNSGGPLLDERCQIVGVISTKANLENVSFAIPAEKIRDLFPSQGKQEE